MQNYAFKTKDNGQEVVALDVAPVHSHTVQKNSRSCESCHNNPKSMGFGINKGKIFASPGETLIVDLMTADGKVIPKKFTIQKPAIKNVNFDWSKIIDENDTQLQTVGHHWSLSRALNQNELSKLDRRGVCLSCHQSMPNRDLAVSLMIHIAQTAGIDIDNDTHKKIIHKNLLLSAWIQVVAGVLLILGVIYWLYRRKRS